MKKILLWVVGILALPLAAGAQMHDCNHGKTVHHNEKDAGGGHHHMMMNRPLQSVSSEGLKLSLDIMDMNMHMNMQKMKGNPVPAAFAKGADHAIMFYVMEEPSRLIIDEADVHYVITGPHGKKEEGKALWYGDHYGAPFKLRDKGSYALKFVVEADGKKTTGNFSHEIN